jgi:TIR domain-containing protein
MSATGEAPSRAGAQKVFICYRREETAPYAGRIYDAMVTRFGIENVFMDLDLAPGVDFVDRIAKVVSGCVALIVVIGPEWARLQNEDGGRRIEDPDDFVRLEVETGLSRDDVLLIPALVDGARMPRREELPPELQTLARRNALELSEGRWAYDVGRLLGTLDELLPDDTEPKKPPEPPPEPEAPTLGWRLSLEGALIAAVTAFVTRVLAQAVYDAHEKGWRYDAVLAGEKIADEETSAELREHVIEIVSWRTVVLAAVGGVLAIWLARRIWRIYPLRHLLRGLLVGALAGLLSGAIFAVVVFLPDKTVPIDTRGQIDLLSFALAGGILGSLIGWFWRPSRVGPGILAGAAGGFLGQGLVVLTDWQSTAPAVNGLKFALVAAAVVGSALVAMLLADRAEAREPQAAEGSPRSGASHSGGSTGGIRPG